MRTRLVGQLSAPGGRPENVILDGVLSQEAITEDVLAAGNKKLVFPKRLELALNERITIPAGADIDFNGSTLSQANSDATDNYQIEVGEGAIIRNLIFLVPAGITIRRAINFKDNTRIYNLKLTSVDQQNNLGSTERSGLNFDGDNIIIDGLICENFDRPIRIENGSYGYFNNILVTSYVTGLVLDTYEFFTINNFVAEVESPNATSSSGHSGMTLTNPQYAIVSNVQINEPSEHGIYLSIGPNDNKKFFSFSNINITRPGQTGLKIAGGLVGGARVQYVQVTGLRVVDPTWGSSPGPNEDGLRLEQADHVHVSGFSVSMDQDGSAGPYYGIYIRDSSDVMIDSPAIDAVAQYGIAIRDEGEAETIENITINNAVIRGGVDSINIDADTSGTVLRNINITNFYAGSPSGYAVNLDMLTAGINQPIRITGIARNAGTGVYNNQVTGSATNLLIVDIKDAEAHETATGTYTLSVHGLHSALNSSGGAVTATLPNGLIVGQRKVITMTNASNSSTVSVTTHETSSPEVFTFNATTDVLVLEWTGALWWTVKNIGVTT